MPQEIKEDIIATLIFKKVNDIYLFNKNKSLRLAIYNLSLKPSSNYNNNKLNNNLILININKELYFIK
jgi:hypothetical protein